MAERERERDTEAENCNRTKCYRLKLSHDQSTGPSGEAVAVLLMDMMRLSNCLRNNCIYVQRIVVLSDLVREVSLHSGQWRLQRFTACHFDKDK